MKYGGIYEDGWMRRDAHVVLEGGEPTDLLLRAHVLPCDGQQLEVRINDETLISRPVASGRLNLRLPLPASSSERRVELRWAKTSPLSDDDPREAAALLQFLDVTTEQPPTALRIPGGLSRPGALHTGIYVDGWTEQEARVLLAGGRDATLLVRGLISDDLRDQHLVVAVDGERMIDADAPPGPFDLRAPLRASERERLVELRWSTDQAVSSADPRRASALLTFVGLASGSPPRAVSRFPSDLADPNLVYSGIDRDGWVRRRTALDIAGGDAAQFVIRAEIPSALRSQRLEVSVDGAAVADEVASDEILDLRVALPATGSDRRIELRWESDCPVSETDPRPAAARLLFIGVTSGPAPNALGRFPADLLDPNLVHSGIYPDGWLARESCAVLAGGEAARLVVRAQVPGHIREQALDVAIGGTRIASETVIGGLVDLQIDIPSADSPRSIELAWATTAPVSEADPRQAAALLDLLALVPRPGR